MRNTIQRSVATRRALTSLILATSVFWGYGYAAIITDFESVGTAGTADISGLTTPEPGNDNVLGESPNQFSLTTTFVTLGIIDKVFTVEDTPEPDPTEFYDQPEEIIINNTGIQIRSIMLEIGFGTGSGFVNVADTAFAGLLDFDLEDFGTSDSTIGSDTFAQVSIDSVGGTLRFFDGVLLPGFSGNIIWSVDVPNGLPADEFTIRQRVPTPPTMALVMLGFGVIGVRGFIRRRRL